MVWPAMDKGVCPAMDKGVCAAIDKGGSVWCMLRWIRKRECMVGSVNG